MAFLKIALVRAGKHPANPVRHGCEENAGKLQASKASIHTGLLRQYYTDQDQSTIDVSVPTRQMGGKVSLASAKGIPASQKAPDCLHF